MTVTNTAVIPARAGSKRFPGKNVKPFLGIPLILLSVRAALACRDIHRTIVTTDDPHIMDLVDRFVEPVILDRRPADLCSDTATSLSVLQYIGHRYLADESTHAESQIVLLQPTSPLREHGLVSRGLDKIAQRPDATSLLGLVEERRFTGRLDNDIYLPDYPETIRSQDIPPTYIPTGCLYIYRYHRSIAIGDAFGTTPLGLVQSAGTFVNIDHEHDWASLEQVYRANTNAYKYLFD